MHLGMFCYIPRYDVVFAHLHIQPLSVSVQGLDGIGMFPAGIRQGLSM